MLLEGCLLCTPRVFASASELIAINSCRRRRLPCNLCAAVVMTSGSSNASSFQPTIVRGHWLALYSTAHGGYNRVNNMPPGGKDVKSLEKHFLVVATGYWQLFPAEAPSVHRSLVPWLKSDTAVLQNPTWQHRSCFLRAPALKMGL